MSNYTHAVIDLETLSTRPEAVVVAIGAVKFDPFGDSRGASFMALGDSQIFYRTIDHALQPHRKTSTETLAWWCEQSLEVQRLTFPLPHQAGTVAQTLRDFADWMKGVEYLWGNGAAFDNAILRSLCADYEVPYPIGYRGDMDLRTLHLCAGKPEKPLFVGIQHYALHDAFNEALIIQDCMRRISPNGQGSRLRPLGQ